MEKLGTIVPFNKYDPTSKSGEFEVLDMDQTLHIIQSQAPLLLQLIRDIMRDPYRGIGKPEPLKHALQGYWSRRITGEHRSVYRVSGDDVRIAQLRHHYRR